MSLDYLRFPSESSRGRRIAEEPHPYRTPFQRDRDRIVHSRAFRRLEAKTQVFTEPLSDHFRTRLTHTLEAAQVARTVALALGLDSDLTEALALAHDIGHPPFGHTGEAALNEQMGRFGEKFNHNLHALAVVDRLELRYADFPGLNLTFEVREGLVKHSHDFEPGESPVADDYLPELRPPLEAQLIDFADEIAYNVADLDDAVEARLLTAEEASDEVRLFGRLLEDARREHSKAHPRRVFNEALRSLMNELVDGLIDGTTGAAREAQAATSYGVRQHRERLARMTERTAATTVELKRMLRRKVYRSAALERDSLQAAEKVGQLFDALLDLPDLMPSLHRERLADEPVHRVVCDYIAGMTDPFLLRRHAELFPGGVS